MTTTQPLADQHLQSTSTEDQMEMGTSPYAQLDDIDFELDDNLESLADQDGMMEEKLDSEIKDDLMEDGSLDNNAIDYEADFAMDPDENVGRNEDNLEQTLVNEISPNKHSNINEIATTSDSTVAEDVDRPERPDTFVEEEEDFLFEEEEFTDNNTSNTLTHNDTNIIDTNKHEPNASAQDETHSTPLINADDDKDTTEVVDFAMEKSAILNSKPDHAAATPNGTLTLVNEDESSAAVDEPKRTVGITHAGNKAIDKEVPAHPEPDIVPDDSDSNSDESHSPYQHSAAIHLHPVTLRYQDQDMSLFPPLEEDDSATYFLGDSSLAYEPFDKILTACRDLLGESIGHDDEMVIDIPSLGLHICEDSKYATKITLAQVIDTYMLLSQNENLSPIKPLHCELSHRVCLTTQMAYLASSAREGKSYSAIMSEHLDLPDFDDSTLEEYAESIAPQDDLNELDGGEDSDNANTTHDLDPTPTTDSPQTFPQPSENLSRNTVKDAAPSKSDPHQNVSDEKLPEISTAIDPANSKPELSSHQNDDIESHSSHTLEDDQEHLTGLDAGSFDPAEIDLLDTDELDFALEEDDLDGNDVTDLDHSTSTKQPDVSEIAENKSNHHVEPTVEITNDDTDEFDKIVDGPVSSGALLATPSKLNGKRKLTDDEDFLEIDISTPEPKRRRPS